MCYTFEIKGEPMKKKTAGLILVFLVSFTSIISADVQDLPAWAPIEFTYKTGRTAAACTYAKSEPVKKVFDLAKAYAASEGEDLRQQLWQSLLEYDQVSPTAQAALLLYFDPEVLGLSHDKIISNLSLANEYPALIELMFARLLKRDIGAEDSPEHDITGMRVYPSIYSIPNYKDYICELRHRECDFGKLFLEIDCFEENVQSLIGEGI